MIRAVPDTHVPGRSVRASGADAIVSGDHHLLDLKEYQGIPIVTPRQFLELLGIEGEE